MGCMAEPPHWQSVEKLRVDNPNLGQRPFHPRALQRDPTLIAAFGRPNPGSDSVLLHTYAPPERVRGAAVILVHGANRSAQYFLDPHEDGSFRDPLPEALRQAGHPVFAVTFAHNQDDNWWQCEALNEAILAVSQRCGGQVCLVAHSKGGCAARLAVTDWRPDPGCRRYLAELVERVILVGCANGGVDFFFRYPSVNLAFSGPGEDPILNWPTPWHQRKVDGAWQELPTAYTARPCLYPGQAQLLARWRERYPLPGLNPDEEMTYEGGEGECGRCHGIERAIAASGDLLGHLRPLVPGVPIGLLAGASPTIPGVLNESSGPSDGIIFVDSALEAPQSARVVGMETLPLQHKALIAEPRAQSAIVAMLRAEDTLSLSEQSARRAQGLALGRELLASASRPASWGAN